MKHLLAIILTLILVAPFAMSNGDTIGKVVQQMVEDVQETSATANFSLEEEIKMFRYFNEPFYTIFDQPVFATSLSYTLRNEALYKHCHFDELIQPPNC